MSTDIRVDERSIQVVVDDREPLDVMKQAALECGGLELTVHHLTLGDSL